MQSLGRHGHADRQFLNKGGHLKHSDEHEGQIVKAQ